jgi:hypothetical protein
MERRWLGVLQGQHEPSPNLGSKSKRNNDPNDPVSANDQL